MKPQVGRTFPGDAAIVTLPLLLVLSTSSIVNVEPAPFDLFAVLLCGFFFALGLRVPRELFMPLGVLGAFLVANAVSITMSPAKLAEKLPYMVFYASLTVYMVILFTLFASVVANSPAKARDAIWRGWLLAALLAVTIAIGAYFRLIPNAERFMMAGRAMAAFKDANVYGPFLVPVMLYLLSNMTGGGWHRTAVRMGCFVYLGIGLLLGFSRGAWGNLVASTLTFGFLHLINARSLADFARFVWAGSAVVALVVGVVAAAISVPQIGEMFERRASLLQRYDTEAGGRFSTQLAALTLIAERPAGIGPNRTKPFLKRNPHNVYLKVLAENGWLGGIAFMTFIGITVWRGLFFAMRPGPYQKPFIAVYASTVGIAAESIIIDTLHWRHYFILLGMLWGLMIAGERSWRSAEASR